MSEELHSFGLSKMLLSRGWGHAHTHTDTDIQ